MENIEVLNELLKNSQQQVSILTELLKKSSSQVDELIKIIIKSNPSLKNDPELYVKRRIDYIRSSSLYEKLSKDPAILIHIIPEGFQADKMSELKFTNKEYIVNLLFPVRAHGADYCFNADGFMVGDDLNNIKFYNQILLNGVFESFNYLRTDFNEPSIYERYLVNDLVKTTLNGIGTLNAVFQSIKFKVYISLNQVKSVKISRTSGYQGPFKIDNLYLPEIELSHNVTSEEIKTALEYPLQIMYQSCNTRYL